MVGVKDRDTNRVSAKVVESTDKRTLQEFVVEHTAPGATVYSDEHASCEGMPFKHESVKHSAASTSEGRLTNGVESFWSTLKRAHKGTFHKLSPKHLDRYVQEFAGKHNIRDADTLEQMTAVAAGLVGRRLMYSQLIAPNGRDSGARPPAERRWIDCRNDAGDNHGTGKTASEGSAFPTEAPGGLRRCAAESLTGRPVV